MSIEVISEKKTKIGQVTVTFTVGRIVSQAKATEGKAGMAGDDDVSVRRSPAGTGLRVGEASADLPATSELMDVTAGETAPNARRAGSAGISPPEVFAAPISSVEER